MNHHVSTDLFGMAYANVQRDRERVIKILAAMPPKPKLIMGPADYAPQHVPQRHRGDEESKEEAAKAARKQLAARCVKYLQEHGAQTTEQLAREFGSTHKAISYALTEVPGIMREAAKGKRSEVTGHYSRSVLWCMPIRNMGVGA